MAKKNQTDSPKVGRPSSYTQVVADLICERIAEGESLRQICRGDDLPDKATVFRWLGENKEFRDQYAHAREAQADALADEILEIADDSRLDTFVDDNGHERTDQEVIGRSRLRVDARKWLASKLAPKKYGEKITQEHTGEMRVVAATDLRDDELAAIAAAGRN